MEVGISGEALGREASGRTLGKFSGGECSVVAFKSTEALVVGSNSMYRFGRNIKKCFGDSITIEHICI